MLYARDSREFKCVQGICRLLGWPCDHSQRSGLLQISKPPEKATDGNAPHGRRLQRFQNPYDDDACEHGTQVWVMVEHQNSLFVLRNPRLQRSFGLAIVYKIALAAIDSVHYSRWRTVGFILLLGSVKDLRSLRRLDVWFDKIHTRIEGNVKRSKKNHKRNSENVKRIKVNVKSVNEIFKRIAHNVSWL